MRIRLGSLSFSKNISNKRSRNSSPAFVSRHQTSSGLRSLTRREQRSGRGLLRRRLRPCKERFGLAVVRRFAERGAEKGFVVTVVKLETAYPGAVFSHTLDDDVYPDIPCIQPGLLVAVPLPTRFSFQRRSPTSHRAIAWRAVRAGIDLPKLHRPRQLHRRVLSQLLQHTLRHHVVGGDYGYRFQRFAGRGGHVAAAE